MTARGIRLTERKRIAAERRCEVKRLAASGMEDAEIAERLGIAKRTVKTIRIEVGELRTGKRPGVKTSMAGLRTSNLPDREISEIYAGARYG